jgi:hypothetical protein
LCCCGILAEYLKDAASMSEQMYFHCRIFRPIFYRPISHVFVLRRYCQFLFEALAEKNHSIVLIWTQNSLQFGLTLTQKWVPKTPEHIAIGELM